MIERVVIAVWILLSCSVGIATAQQDSAKKVTDARNFGLLFGASYSIMQLDAMPYFVDTTQAVGKATVGNSLGLSIGIFYNFPLSKKVLLRTAVEAHLMPSLVKYDLIKRKTEHWVYPLTIDVPFYLVYGNNEVGSFGNRKFSPQLLAAVRPVIPLSILSSSQPVVKNFNLNVDVGVSFPKVLKKSTLRSEVFYSYGLLNIIGEDQENFRTASITSLRRHFVGCRFFFN